MQPLQCSFAMRQTSLLHGTRVLASGRGSPENMGGSQLTEDEQRPKPYVRRNHLYCKWFNAGPNWGAAWVSSWLCPVGANDGVLDAEEAGHMEERILQMSEPLNPNRIVGDLPNCQGPYLHGGCRHLNSRCAPGPSHPPFYVHFSYFWRVSAVISLLLVSGYDFSLGHI